MAWRNLIITKPSRLNFKNNNIVIKSDEFETEVPLEDVSTLLLEHPQITITHTLLSNLSINNIVVITTSEKYMPVAILNSLVNHSRSLKVINNQLNISKPLKNRIWQLNIQQKIINQAKVLEIMQLNGVDKLIQISKTMESGDKSNREAYASRLYFKYLFGDSFNRRVINNINSSLNYGYAILRSAISRTIVSYGYLPMFGIHHENELNNFNLADDFIESYRPLIDLITFKIFKFIDLDNDKLSSNHRYELVNSLNLQIIVDDTMQTVLNSIDLLIKSFTTCITTGDYKNLKIPTLIPIKLRYYEL